MILKKNLMIFITNKDTHFNSHPYCKKIDPNLQSCEIAGAYKIYDLSEFLLYSDRFGQTLADIGRLWQTLADFGRLWQT
jgi:hypothetical protein